MCLQQQQQDVFELLKQADIAMYSAKHSAQSIVIFDEELHEGMEAEFQLLADLKVALSKGELTLHYQPIIASQSGDIYGVEALLRWPGDGSMLLPEQFVAVAEKNNLTRQLSAWVINRVFQDLAILLECVPSLGCTLIYRAKALLSKPLICWRCNLIIIRWMPIALFSNSQKVL